ncbi:DNA topoisomerase 2-binding protein 1-A isoform X2 [Durio zibethinus]|uniref:DNA topoisomerase 2-binding protein 1-A isoform X2 n=1 Tax=Durio zibethinus TaxID=66656 RepID=A0A6P6ATF0_DURZI|nr:DNA topoisomerase 2-binding protein 1-A isoform X2 [Durio zibethinus]
MMKTKAFKGSNVFMSRNLVPPEVFDKLHGVLKDNGAQVFLCCDPSRNGPDDFHVISSIDHDKFEDLRAKGCNLLGPQCVLSCAKENRALPKQGFTCCLAMDSLKVLASGFDIDEKVKIEKLVTAMGGVLHTKASLEVSFVVVKNVLAAKYKWALNVLKKPIVTIHWLYQCWSEHRIVPQESYRVLPFSGLTICVTRIPADERKEIEKLIIQNGGKYSAELTKKCTHLICDAPEGDKYKVARRWGLVHIVVRKWFDQSIARRACLNEESYPVQGGCASLKKNVSVSLSAQHSQDKFRGSSVSATSSVVPEFNLSTTPSTGLGDPDLEATLSQNMSSAVSDAQVIFKEDGGEAPILQPSNDTKLDGCVANDSQSEDNDLYLSDCRISLVGFEASEMRKLVTMVRRGGASRYMSCNDKLTHIIVGTPSEVEKKEIRGLAASGVIHVVKPNWLEDCDRQKKEIPVHQSHVAYELLLPKDSVLPVRGAVTGMISLNQSKSLVLTNSRTEMPPSLGKSLDDKPKINMKGSNSLEATVGSSKRGLLPIVNSTNNGAQKQQCDSIVQNLKNGMPSTVFKGKTFCFSISFPEDRRAEIVEWVDQGGGQFVADQVKGNVNFIIECHGVIRRSMIDSQITYVSTHWVRSCLEAGCLLDVGSHILYSPLPCQIPFPGFKGFRFCVSQYEEKDRLLLRNLCFILGAKFVEKLTKKVTHLLCKFTSGPKYEAAFKWGIHSVTSEWIYECVRQNKVVSLDPFCPKEVTAQDQEAGLCTVSQFPTQAVQMMSVDIPSQFMSQSQELRTQALGVKNGTIIGDRNDGYRDGAKQSIVHLKKARHLEDDGQNGPLASGVHLCEPVLNENSTENNKSKIAGEAAQVLPDVAAAIEDLLEQTSKIHDQKSPERDACDKSIFSSDCTGLHQDHTDSHSVIGLSRHWLSRTVRKDEISSYSGDVNVGGLYDGFSETQTESQVVGYEEDLSGRQMLIDRVRTRSSMA